MKLTEQDIEELNNSKDFDSWYQGVYLEPYGIPNDMKELVVYKRWCKGGAEGGSCWGDEAEYFEGDDEPDFVVLNLVLSKVAPSITLKDYQEIQKHIISSDESDWEYYGNYKDWGVCYLPLSKIYSLLEQLGYDI